MAEPKVSLLLTLVDKLTAPVEGAKKSLASFGDSVTGLGAKIAALGVTAALGAFFKSSVEEAIKAEASTIRLGHAVKNAGEDFDAWAPQIDATINRLTKLTTFTDDDLAAALGDLITKTGDVAGSLKNMGLVTDLAVNKNISLEESATLVAKALNGGGRLFKEYGITAGTAAEKTEQLANILKGSAAAAADSFGGRLSNLGKAWGELKEDTGKAIMANAAVGDALTSLTALIDTLAPKIASFVGWIVSDMVTSVTRIVTDVQKIGAAAALAILGVPDRFKLAWGKMTVAIANTISENRVLLTVFGDGLTKVADKMGASGVKMVRESEINLRNLKAGYDEVVSGITTTVEKGEKDKTTATTTGNRLRLDSEEKSAKDKKDVWTGSANVFKDEERRRAEATIEAQAVIRATWGLSSDYIIRETNKIIAVHRVEAAALGTIIDGMDGVYGSSVAAAPKVAAIGDEAFNAARGAISLAQEFGTVDATAASVLTNVVNLADTLKDGLKGLSAGNLVGAVGALAGIMGGLFGDSPEAKARKELLAKNTQRLQELRDRMGELLSISTPGGKIATLQGVGVDALVSATRRWNRGDQLEVGKVGQFLARRGMSLTDFRQLASDLGIDLNDKNGSFDIAAVQQLFSVLGSGQFTGFSNDLSGLVGRVDFLSGIQGSSAGDTLAQLGGALSSGSGSSALGGLFSGATLGDGIDPTEAATIQQRAIMLAARFAGGGVSASEMGGASNTVFMSLLERVIDLLGNIANTNATTAGAVTGGGLGAIVDTDLGSSYDLSRVSLGG